METFLMQFDFFPVTIWSWRSGALHALCFQAAEVFARLWVSVLFPVRRLSNLHKGTRRERIRCKVSRNNQRFGSSQTFRTKRPVFAASTSRMSSNNLKANYSNWL